MKSIIKQVEELAKLTDLSHLEPSVQIEELAERNAALVFIINQLAYQIHGLEEQIEVYKTIVPSVEKMAEQIASLFITNEEENGG